MNKILKRTLLLLSSLAILGSASAILLIYVAIGSAIEEIPFEGNSWKNDTNRAQMNFPRQGMAEYLINKNILSGKSEKQILSMLGAPDHKDRNLNKTTRLIYFLGPGRSIASADNEWLVIHFNSKGKVTKCIRNED